MRMTGMMDDKKDINIQDEKKDKKRNDEDFIHEKERLKWEDEIEIER